MVMSDESMCTASLAGLSGDAAREESSSSRRTMSASTSSKSVEPTPRCSFCSTRLFARASLDAVRNTFTSAPGNTTVPMSRPSTT